MRVPLPPPEKVGLSAQESIDILNASSAALRAISDNGSDGDIANPETYRTQEWHQAKAALEGCIVMAAARLLAYCNQYRGR